MSKSKQYVKPVFIITTDPSKARVTGDVQAQDQRLALDTLLTEAGVDPKIWFVESYKISKKEWDVTMKLREYDGKQRKNDVVHTATNEGFSVIANLKRILPVLDLDMFRHTIEELLNIQIPAVEPKIAAGFKKSKEGNLFVSGIVDPHIGKLAWEKESKTNYDVQIAQDFHKEALQDLMAKAIPFDPQATLLPTDNDTFNYDFSTPYPMTTAGTPQEADVRWQKMFRIGVGLWIQTIESLKKFGPVFVKNIQGNHDYHLGFLLGEVLAMRYANDDMVVVDNDPFSRKYFEWGRNMIGLAHGKWERANIVHNMMSIDEPEMWGRTKYRYYYLGDRHHEEELRSRANPVRLSEDFRGVLIEFLPTMSQVDKYEYTRGFVGTIKGARAMVHNDVMGRIAKLGFNL